MDRGKQKTQAMKKSADVRVPTTAAAPSGLSSKLMRMKFMRQAASKEKQAEFEEQKRQVDDASRWSLGVEPKDVKMRVKVVTGFGFHAIDSREELEDAPRGRRSWGMFNEKFDPEGIKKEEDDEEEEEEEGERRRREKVEEDNMIKHARTQKSVSGSGTPATKKRARNGDARKTKKQKG